jgi:hypothetical protein
MKDTRRKFFKFQIPYFIKNALVEVFTTQRNKDSTQITMEVLPGSKL